MARYKSTRIEYIGLEHIAGEELQMAKSHNSKKNVKKPPKKTPKEKKAAKAEKAEKKKLISLSS